MGAQRSSCERTAVAGLIVLCGVRLRFPLPTACCCGRPLLRGRYTPTPARRSATAPSFPPPRVRTRVSLKSSLFYVCLSRFLSCTVTMLIVITSNLSPLLLLSTYNADPVVRGCLCDGSSWGYLALPQFSKLDSFPNQWLRPTKRSVRTFSSYDTAPAPISKGLPSLLLSLPPTLSESESLEWHSD